MASNRLNSSATSQNGASSTPTQDVSRVNAGRSHLELSQQARSHPLFPMLDYIARGVHLNTQKVTAIETRCERIEQGIRSIKQVQEELIQLTKSTTTDNFCLKKSGYEKPLRCGVASLFCDSLKREISDENLVTLVRKVLKETSQERHKFDVAFKFAKHTASTFQTEERRRILGIAPCQSAAQLPTIKLAAVVMTYLKAPQSKEEKYTKHLALLRKYVRNAEEKEEVRRNMYGKFKEWLDKNFPPNGSPSETDFKDVLEEDEAFYIAGDAVQDNIDVVDWEQDTNQEIHTAVPYYMEEQ